MLNEGMMFVNGMLITLDPIHVEFNEKNAVSFNVVDSYDGDTARGDYNKSMGGVVRPRLEWFTSYTAN
jgi:lipopolysaccharide transport system ATP-binding protein